MCHTKFTKFACGHVKRIPNEVCKFKNPFLYLQPSARCIYSEEVTDHPEKCGDCKLLVEPPGEGSSQGQRRDAEHSVPSGTDTNTGTSRQPTSILEAQKGVDPADYGVLRTNSYPSPQHGDIDVGVDAESLPATSTSQQQINNVPPETAVQPPPREPELTSHKYVDIHGSVQAVRTWTTGTTPDGVIETVPPIRPSHPPPTIRGGLQLGPRIRFVSTKAKIRGKIRRYDKIFLGLEKFPMERIPEEEEDEE